MTSWFLVVLFVTHLPSSLAGQAPELESRQMDGDSSFVCVLKSEDRDAFHYLTREDQPAVLGKAASNIVVTFVNQTSTDVWPDQAKDALNFAAGIWGGILNSQVAIRIEATWTDLGNCTGSQFALASAGPQLIWRNFRNAPRNDTWYPDALADALHGADLSPGKADIVAKFNRSCGPSGSGKWHLGTDGKPPSGTIDMVSVALHEFAHGLGVFGSADVDDGQSSNGNECNGTDGVGCIGSGDPRNPFSYDRHTEDSNGVPLLALSNPSSVLGTALEGGRAGGIFFSGPKLTEAGFSRARLYAPPTFNSGASYAHVDENTYNPTPEALMTPFLGRAESIHFPGDLACGILADGGWTISGNCAKTNTATEPTASIPGEMIVSGPYPNPLKNETTIVVSVPTDRRMSIEIFDALGRPVLQLFEGVMSAGRQYRLRLDGFDYPPGVYIVTLRSEFGVTARPMVVAD